MWSEFGNGMEDLFGLKALAAPKKPPNILLEIVSANELIQGTNCHCLVSIGSRKLHRTAVIRDDTSPIWTIKTGSLCLLHISDTGKNEDGENSLLIEVKHETKVIGIVQISFLEILEKNGEREEFIIQPAKECVGKKSKEKALGTLALRFRKATNEDIQLIHEMKLHAKKKGELGFRDIIDTMVDDNAGSVSDKENGKGNATNTLLFPKKQYRDGTCLLKVQPYPDPDRRAETTWMSQEKMNEEALKPSRKWFGAGDGEFGKVYLEIISCSDLPDLDSGLGSDLTDPFVCAVFENSMVRTNILHDTLDPCWMPWADRAFCFDICHPSSLIFVGLFDYDSIGNNAPIGRVVINIAKFRANTSYLLRYQLNSAENPSEKYGIITIRLRIKLENERHFMEGAMTPPPKFLINVHSQKSLEMLRYLCRGAVNMDNATVDTISIYYNELKQYGSVICYTIDVLFSIWLWRGRRNVLIFGKKYSFWFPVHSIFLFLVANLAINYPLLIPSLILYSVAWTIFSIGYSHWNHPDPWQRCKPALELALISHLEKTNGIYGPDCIEPSEIVTKEAESYEHLNQLKADRVGHFLYNFMYLGLKLRRIYKKSDIVNIVIATEDKAKGWNLLEDKLYYIHLMLSTMVSTLNSLRGFLNWRGCGAYNLMRKCIIFGTACLLIPYFLSALSWFARIYIWIFLGPFMKLIDIYLVHPYYRTDEELKANPKLIENNISEKILSSEKVQQMVFGGRLATEEAMKLKDMREYRFGKLSQRIPAYDTQRKPDIPMSNLSRAEPYLESNNDGEVQGFIDLPPEQIQWKDIPGQKLVGNMVHHHATPTKKRESKRLMRISLNETDGRKLKFT